MSTHVKPIPNRILKTAETHGELPRVAAIRGKQKSQLPAKLRASHRAARHTLRVSRLRAAALDLSASERKHLIHALLEVDVTDARRSMHEHEATTGEALSFTAYIICCVARAVGDDTRMQAYRSGRRTLVIFDDVDVTVLIERLTDGREEANVQDERTLFHIIRAANAKSLHDINSELRTAKYRSTSAHAGQLSLRLFAALPSAIRRLGVRFVRGRPSLWKRFGGTVAVTSVGMFGTGTGWGIPTTSNTLDVTVGGIALRPIIVEGQTCTRELLSLTLSMDHDVVDGAPAARFAQHLKELIESGYGLDRNETA